MYICDLQETIKKTMAQIPTPPLSRDVSKDRDISTLESTSPDQGRLLDTLLERYLNLLDRHQTLQAEFGEQLSSGFLSLAHANYCSPPGRRYGEDYYDQRMKATRKLILHTLPSPEQALESDLSSLRYKVQYTSLIPAEDDGEEETEKSEKEESSETNTNTSRKKEEREQGTKFETDNTAESDIPTRLKPSKSPEIEQDTQIESPKLPKKPFRSDDPLSWYGILVPSSLKSAQRSFTQAISYSVPELASLINEMYIVEERVGNLRKDIGLSGNS